MSSPCILLFYSEEGDLLLETPSSIERNWPLEKTIELVLTGYHENRIREISGDEEAKNISSKKAWGWKYAIINNLKNKISREQYTKYILNKRLGLISNKEKYYNN